MTSEPAGQYEIQSRPGRPKPFDEPAYHLHARKPPTYNTYRRLSIERSARLYSNFQARQTRQCFKNVATEPRYHVRKTCPTTANNASARLVPVSHVPSPCTSENKVHKKPTTKSTCDVPFTVPLPAPSLRRVRGSVHLPSANLTQKQCPIQTANSTKLKRPVPILEKVIKPSIPSRSTPKFNLTPPKRPSSTLEKVTTPSVSSRSSQKPNPTPLKRALPTPGRVTKPSNQSRSPNAKRHRPLTVPATFLLDDSESEAEEETDKQDGVKEDVKGEVEKDKKDSEGEGKDVEAKDKKVEVNEKEVEVKEKEVEVKDKDNDAKDKDAKAPEEDAHHAYLVKLCASKLDEYNQPYSPFSPAAEVIDQGGLTTLEAVEGRMLIDRKDRQRRRRSSVKQAASFVKDVVRRSID